MILRLCLAMFVPLSIGFFLMHIFLPFKSVLYEHLLLKSSFAVGLGFGITSCTYFLCLLFGPTINGIILLEAGILVFLMFFIYAIKTRIYFENHIESETILNDFKLKRMLSAGFYLVLVLASINIIYIAMLVPNGTWDAWAIWNMHAQFIFRGGEYWRDGFSILLAPKQHPDYPLLLPLTVARGWTYIGRETLAVPMAISLLFTSSIAGLIYSALTLLKSKSQGIVASLFLLSTPVFLFNGARQEADIPIAFFFLAGIVFLFLQDRYPEKYGLSSLSGAMAGFAGWTKNEGLLFLFSFFVARIIGIVVAQNRKKQIKQLMYFVVGSMPVLAIIIYFKVNLAPPSDLVSGERGISEIILRVKDFARYVEIMTGFMKGILFTIPQVLLLLFYPKFVGARIADIGKTDNFTSVLVLILMMAGYFCVYLITPYDLAWHLKYSLSRLLLQLWPSILLTYFMIARTPEEVLISRQIEMISECPIKGIRTC